MAIVLDIAIGAPMQCTKNVSRSMKLANGTIGHDVSVQNNEHDRISTTEVNGITIITHFPKAKIPQRTPGF